MRYKINHKLRQPAYMQLYMQLRRDITEGVYPYGSRLPSKRDLAEETFTSVITVRHAYDILVDEGYAQARERSGYYASYRDGDLFSSPGAEERQPTWRQPSEDSQQDHREDFPFSVLATTMRRVLSQYQEQIMESSPPGGTMQLRRALAAYLARGRGMKVSADQIIVGSGAEDLYGLIVPMLGREMLYAIEDPSYPKIRQIYEAHGVQIEKLKMGVEGIRREQLQKSRAQVLHVTPFNSYPSRVTATASKRAQYIRWAQERRAMIVEDDYDSEYSELTKAEDTLFSLEPERTVIYVNTFSKTIASSMRMGYMVLPRERASQLLGRIDYYSCSVPVFEQYVLTELIENGDFERHINRIRRARRRQRAEE